MVVVKNAAATKIFDDVFNAVDDCGRVRSMRVLRIVLFAFVQGL